MSALWSTRLARYVAAVALVVSTSAAASGGRVGQAAPLQLETLSPIAALPAHIAGSFRDMTACQQTPGGEYFVFDRRGHTVYVVQKGQDTARKLIEIGAEAGRLLDPTAFKLADDGTFAVADAPGGTPRVQMFTTSGSSLNGFYLQGRALPRIALGNRVLSGIASMEYSGRHVALSQPELGGLIVEYGIDGRTLRTFGELRRTGHEDDRDVHLALNSGVPIRHPAGGYYFVFLSGVPQFRRYDAGGTLMYERHIEGRELDRVIQSLPTTWKRQRVDWGEIPLVLPTVYAAGVDATGNLWVSLAVGVTYVYDTAGDKRRVVEFQGAGTLLPSSFSFTNTGRVLVTPGCYAFPAR